MRFKNHLKKNLYIGIRPRTNEKKEYPDNVEKLLKRLNTILERNYNDKYVFDIVKESEFKSPSDVVKTRSKKKFENIIKEWMLQCEEFESIKHELTQ